ncbi:hypothetical protein Hs30E_16270 [Lactococcus hodotermopsidis]|uniref:Uncharacterized protein n=2 Tax=Pseudolactococcus hodotermopsidis TaxID=2709157 RepID=A0A6A0BE46_9LACT|nr:hypothetical protein Hs30E_16270 [Lactococcus hodotermopsidis]
MTFYTFDTLTYRTKAHSGIPLTEHLKIGLSRKLARKMGLKFDELPEMPNVGTDDTKIFVRTYKEVDFLAQIGENGKVVRSQIPNFEFDATYVDYGVVILLNFDSEMIDDRMANIGWNFYQAPRNLTKKMADFI